MGPVEGHPSHKASYYWHPIVEQAIWKHPGTPAGHAEFEAKLIEVAVAKAATKGKDLSKEGKGGCSPAPAKVAAPAPPSAAPPPASGTAPAADDPEKHSPGGSAFQHGSRASLESPYGCWGYARHPVNSGAERPPVNLIPAVAAKAAGPPFPQLVALPGAPEGNSQTPAEVAVETAAQEATKNAHQQAIQRLRSRLAALQCQAAAQGVGGSGPGNSGDGRPKVTPASAAATRAGEDRNGATDGRGSSGQAPG